MTAPEAMRKIRSIANQYREGDNEVALGQLQRIREIAAEVHDLDTQPGAGERTAATVLQKENPS